MKLITTPLLLLTSTLLASSPLPARDAKLIQSSPWTLKSWTKAGIEKKLSEPSLTLSFDRKQLNGTSGVNFYSGTYLAKAGKFKVDGLSITERGGPPALMKLEAEYNQLLISMKTYAVDQSNLTLTDGTDQNQLHFVAAKKAQAKPLVGTSWSLTTFESGKGPAGTAASLIAATRVSLTINKEGRVSGTGGVNRYFTTAKVGKDGSISFGPLGSTRRAGPPEHMVQETTYFKQLKAMTSYSIKGNALTLSNKDGSLGLVFVSIE